MLTKFLLSAAVIALPVAAAVAVPTSDTNAEVRFVPMKDIMVPIIDAKTVDGVLSVDLVLQTADDSSAAALTARLAVLRAASVATILDFSTLHASGLTPVNAEILRATVETALRRDNPAIAHVLVVKVAATAA